MATGTATALVRYIRVDESLRLPDNDLYTNRFDVPFRDFRQALSGSPEQERKVVVLLLLRLDSSQALQAPHIHGTSRSICPLRSATQELGT